MGEFCERLIIVNVIIVMSLMFFFSTIVLQECIVHVSIPKCVNAGTSRGSRRSRRENISKLRPWTGTHGRQDWNKLLIIIIFRSA